VCVDTNALLGVSLLFYSVIAKILDFMLQQRRSSRPGPPTSSFRTASGWAACSTHSRSWQPSCSPWHGRTNGLWTKCACSVTSQRSIKKISTVLLAKERMFMDFIWKVREAMLFVRFSYIGLLTAVIVKSSKAASEVS